MYRSGSTITIPTGTFHGEGTKVRSWTTGNTQYTETSYYDIVRDMDIDFVKIPVDASVGMPDDVMDLMEPFDYKELQEFKPEYLSGFHSERYNMTSDLVESVPKPRCRRMHRRCCMTAILDIPASAKWEKTST